MSDFYGIRDDKESIATIHHALDRGLNFPDKADLYGPFTNELLIGQAMAERRKDVLIATKFGMTRDPANPGARGSNGSLTMTRLRRQPQALGYRTNRFVLPALC